MEQTRIIWEGRCPECGTNGCIPDLGGVFLAASRWCYICSRPVECHRISYTGPRLEPMVPDVHHVWCNGQRGPVKGCRWCCPSDGQGGYLDGMWAHYPYDPATGPGEHFTEQYFPNAKVRR